MADIFSTRSMPLIGLRIKLSAPASNISMILPLSAVVVMTKIRSSGKLSLYCLISRLVSPVLVITRSMKSAGLRLSLKASVMAFSVLVGSRTRLTRLASLPSASSLTVVRSRRTKMGSSESTSSSP